MDGAAYFNGRFVSRSKLAVDVEDLGFVMGLTVVERLRTFGGRLFELDPHFDRLDRSLDIVGFRPTEPRERLIEIARQIVADSKPLTRDGGDLGLTIFVTPGDMHLAMEGRLQPSVGLYASPLDYAGIAQLHAHGQALQTTGVAQIPPDCWPIELKCRSRMHYWLADREAAKVDPEARAVLFDQQGMLSEASTANVVLYNEAEGLVSPPAERMLPGVSLAFVESLAVDLGVPFLRRDLTADDLADAEEILLCSTSPCVWSASRFNGRPPKFLPPGPISAQLRAAWSERVEVDIEAQARRLARV